MPWPTAHIPIASGMDQKTDPRALEAPSLPVCKNAEFEEIGGTQKRKTFSTMPGQSKPGDHRRLAVVENELLLFTKSKIYSYAAGTDEWIERDDALAPSVSEVDLLATTDDQGRCERAELDGVVLVGWRTGSTSVGYLAALDAETGALIAGPQQVTASAIRIVALEDRFAVFMHASNTFSIRMMLPSNIDSSTTGEGISGAAQVSVTADGPMDACRVPDEDKALYACRGLAGGNTTYRVGVITGGASGAPTDTNSTKTQTSQSEIGVAVAPDGRYLVCRDGSTSQVVEADLYTAALADDTVNTTVLTGHTGGVDSIAVEYRTDTVGGEYVADVFASVDEDESATTGYIQHNTINTAGTIGTEAELMPSASIVSRAFNYDGSVYFWAAFAQENIAASSVSLSSTFSAALQNTYFLVNVSGDVLAKAVTSNASGFRDGHLSTVQKLSSTSFVWCGGRRRRYNAAATSSTQYANRSPVSIPFEMDSDEARRVVQVGRTGYVSGGQVMQFDGQYLVEVGFHVYPWAISGSMAGSGGSLSSGDYTYISTLRWDNGRGEFERSTTATYGSITAAASDKATLNVSPSPFTLKQGDVSDPAQEIWRSPVNPTASSDFYLVTQIQPTATSNPNRYLANDPDAQLSANFDDDDADTTIDDKEAYPYSGSTLGNVAPPPATVIATGQGRAFLAGVAGFPQTIYYSKTRADGEIVSFNDQLAVEVPADGGALTGLAFLNETLVAFCERGIYMLPGEGYTNVLGGQNYGPVRLLSVDVGADSAESIAVIPEGVIFRSSKGWYLLDRGWGVKYIGGSVSDYDEETIVSVLVLESQHQVRIATTSRLLVWDTLTQQWSEWDEPGIVGSVVWQGKHIIATDDDVLQQDTETESAQFALDLESSWIKPSGLQGFARGRKLSLLGELVSDCRVRLRIAYDYDEVNGEPNWVDDKSWTPSPATLGGPLRVKHRFSRQRFSAFKIRITDEHPTLDGVPAEGGAFKLTGLSLEYKEHEGLRRLPASQKQ